MPALRSVLSGFLFKDADMLGLCARTDRVEKTLDVGQRRQPAFEIEVLLMHVRIADRAHAVNDRLLALA